MQVNFVHVLSFYAGTFFSPPVCAERYDPEADDNDNEPKVSGLKKNTKRFICSIRQYNMRYT